MKRYHDDALSGQGIIGSTRPIAIGVHPNPSRDRIQFSGLSTSARSFVLRDAMGRMALAAPLVQSPIDLSGIASGSYVIEVLDAHSARLGTARVMKE
ncbi:MAG: T9SS type A sorting domain-containing protein [Flavobacteriales bacterium]|nr:T9SS type A sorting domain-containing protein [Flavobacteriales bacterium]